MIIDQNHIPSSISNTIPPIDMPYPPLWFILSTIFTEITGTTKNLFLFLKIFSFLLPIFIFIFFYKLVNELFKKKIAIISSLLVVFSINSGSYFGIFYPGPVILNFLLNFIYFFLVVKYIKNKNANNKINKYLILSSLFLFLGFMTHFLSFVIFMIVLIVIFYNYIFKISTTFNQKEIKSIKENLKKSGILIITNFYLAIFFFLIFWGYDLNNIQDIFGFFSNNFYFYIFLIYLFIPVIIVLGTIIYVRFIQSLKTKKNIIFFFLIFNIAILLIFIIISIVMPEILYQSLYNLEGESNFWTSTPDPFSLNIPFILQNLINNVLILIPNISIPFLFWIIILNPILIIISIIGIIKLSNKKFRNLYGLNINKINSLILLSLLLIFFILFLNYGIRIILYLLPLIAIFFALGYIAISKKNKFLIFSLISFIIIYNTVENYFTFSDPWHNSSLDSLANKINLNLSDSNILYLTIIDHRSYHPYFYLQLDKNFSTYYIENELPKMEIGDYLFISPYAYNRWGYYLENSTKFVKYLTVNDGSNIFNIYICIF
jgi:hypothetical protein